MMFLAVGAGRKRLTTRSKRTTTRMRSTTRVTCKVELCGRILLCSKESLFGPFVKLQLLVPFRTSSFALAPSSPSLPRVFKHQGRKSEILCISVSQIAIAKE